ncbi:MAG: hypothetical protein ACFFE4_00090 [Candidatus Thorarchaeota archaeon]
MKDLNEIPEFSKYFRVIPPTIIEVNKEEIFYRDKYNEIISYIKAMATYEYDSILNNYLNPKGAILVNVNPGTDILDFLKLISLNYHLELIELEFNEIKKSPESFLENFGSILTALRRLSQNEKDLKAAVDASKESSEGIIERKLFVINQQLNLRNIFNGKNLLEIFLSECIEDKFSFIDSNILVIWVNYNIQDILDYSSKVYDSFDLFIKIQLLNKIERETVFRDFLEKNPKIVFDINALVDATEKWEVMDIKKLLKIGILKQFLNSELNETSNEITQILLDLINSGEYIPVNKRDLVNEQFPKRENTHQLNVINEIPKKERSNDSEEIKIESYLESIRNSRISDFMLNQLYENAAFKNYSELVIIIDKLDKKEPLEINDRKLLAEYPFILNDSPNIAQINLEKAKKRVDRIKQAFAK